VTSSALVARDRVVPSFSASVITDASIDAGTERSSVPPRRRSLSETSVAET